MGIGLPKAHFCEKCGGVRWFLLPEKPNRKLEKVCEDCKAKYEYDFMQNEWMLKEAK
jgi:hypothetical protein